MPAVTRAKTTFALQPVYLHAIPYQDFLILKQESRRVPELYHGRAAIRCLAVAMLFAPLTLLIRLMTMFRWVVMTWGS